MAPSQLKRLKKGIKEKRSQRGGKSTVRKYATFDDTNFFDLCTSSRPKKFDVTTSSSTVRGRDQDKAGRPTFMKSVGENTRKQTILREINSRNKVGGVLDRRIGEGNLTLTPEEKTAQRVARQARARHSSSIFNLEEEEDELTHYGRPIEINNLDDYKEASSDNDSDQGSSKTLKRKMGLAEEIIGNDAFSLTSERKRTKTEVMHEIIEKSKLHKYERQKEKEEDDELREELDREVVALLAALKPANGAQEITRKLTRKSADDMVAKASSDKMYDENLRSMSLDKRAQPSERTLSTEEKLLENSNRAEEQSRKRLLRMAGIDDDSGDDYANSDEQSVDLDNDYFDEGKIFGLEKYQQSPQKEIFEEEDDFLIDTELVATNSDTNESTSSSNTKDLSQHQFETTAKSSLTLSRPIVSSNAIPPAEDPGQVLAFPCPQNHEELQTLLSRYPGNEIIRMIQRIRAIYHPQLSSDNNEKLSRFAVALIDFLVENSLNDELPLSTIDSIIRHLHSLSRTYPEAIGKYFMVLLRRMSTKLSINISDIVILRAIGAIYSTSDHFHPVVTPAMTILARWFSISRDEDPYTTLLGSSLVDICVQYQQFSRRYIPEVASYTVSVLCRENLKKELRTIHERLFLKIVELWVTKPSLIELANLGKGSIDMLVQDPVIRQKVLILWERARLSRRPLEMHHHRPLPIKTQTPKFEESFAPTKHYDLTREKQESNKLKAEYKRERKGALRELRKDSSFIAREKLAEKKRQDKAYEVKYNKIIADIQRG